MTRSLVFVGALLLVACGTAPAVSDASPPGASTTLAPTSIDEPTPIPPPDASAAPPSAGLEGQIAYVAGLNDPQIHLLDLATGDSRQLTSLRPEDGDPSATGPLRPAQSCAFGPTGLTWSPDGSRLAFSYGGCEGVLWLVDMEGNLRRLGEGYGPAWSPDGRMIAFGPNRPFAPCGPGCMGEPAVAGAWDLQVIEVDGGTARPLGSDGATFGGGAPAYSPDGSMIAFSGPLPEPANDPELFQAAYVVDADGANPRLIARGAWPSGWLPDGRLVLVEERRGSTSAVDLDTADAELLADGATVEAIAPDGSRLLAHRFHPVTGITESLLVNLDGTILAEMDGYAVDWAADGKAFLVVDPEASTIAIHAADGTPIGAFAVEPGASDIRARWRPAP